MFISIEILGLNDFENRVKAVLELNEEQYFDKEETITELNNCKKCLSMKLIIS